MKNTPSKFISKKIFEHNKELDKLPVAVPFKDFKEHNPAFYAVDREELLEVMPYEQRTSMYWCAGESIDDLHLIQLLVKTMGTVTCFVAGRPVQLSFNQKEAEQDDKQFSNYSGEKISVGLGPMFDHRVPFFTRLNIVVGTTIHETMHIVETTPGAGRWLMKNGCTKTKLNKFGKASKIPDYNQTNKIFADNKLWANLFNVVEDRRIENKALQKCRGFVFYMDEMRKYALWMHFNQMQDKGFKFDAGNPDEYWKAVSMYMTYRTFSPELIPHFLKKAPNDSKFKEICSKVDTILDKSCETFEDSLAISKELFDLFPKDQQDKAKGMGKSMAADAAEQPQKGPGKEAEGKVPEKAKEAIAEASKEAQNEQTDKKEPIDKVHTAKGDKRYDTVGIHPAKKGEFDKNVFNEALEISRSIAKNLSFLDSRFNRSIENYELQSGNIDEDELYSLGHNRAIFTEEEEAPGYSMDLCILIDESGSMGWGPKIHQAKVAALAMALALQHNDSINLYVYGHTADHKSGEHVSLYRYLDPKERATDINTLFSVKARSNNADGYAIAKMDEVLKRGTSMQKVLIVVSDGQPAASCYGDGIGHTRDMVTMLEKKGIFVVQICVDNVDASGKMFTHFVPFNKEKLGVNLRKVLMKKLVEVSNMI